jgi:hypothetical protein
VSDEKLRELERAWTSEPSGDTAVAYLAELLRSGEVRQLEARLAWRVARLEWSRAGVPRRASWMSEEVLSAPFDPSDPGTAVMVLGVLLAETGPNLQSRVAAIQDVVRGVLMDEGVIQNPLDAPVPPGVRVLMNPPARCNERRHLGPIDYDGTHPRCGRCGHLVTHGPNGSFLSAMVQICSSELNMHLGPMREHTEGQVCTACGEVVVPVRAGGSTGG